MPLSKKHITEIKESYISAEKSLKFCENVIGELPQGAVNELRYASSHLVEFLETEKKEELDKFHRHCKRARYDAQELTVLFLTKEMDIYLKRFLSNEDIARDILGEEYKKILDAREEIDEILTKASQSQENRQDYLDKIQSATQLLKDSLQTIKKLMPAIQARIKRERRTIAFTIVGIILAAIALL